jgi:cytoskeletal protein CcmA (bactofilin family)
MFGNSKNKRSAEIDSLVGGNTTIRGDVHFTGGLHVDGTVEGNVIADSENSVLTTSEQGRIEGDVTVHNIVLNGEVVGDVHALDHIELASKARVTGNVYYHVIEMAMGAEVNGNLIHVKNGEKPAAKPQTKPQTQTKPSEVPPQDELKVASK